MSTIKLPASPATVGVLVLGVVALGAELAAKAGEAAAERLREARIRVRARLQRGGVR